MKNKNLGIMISLWKTYEVALRVTELKKRNLELQREINRLHLSTPNPCREIDIYGNELDRLAKEIQKYQSKIMYTTTTTNTSNTFPANVYTTKMI